MPGTVRLHRVLPAPPSRVWTALTDPDAFCKWNAPHGFVAKVQRWDAKVGGQYKMSFTNLGTGSSHSFGGTIKEMDAPHRFSVTDSFDDPGVPGQMLTTYQLKECMVGTDLTIVQEGIPDQIPEEMCYLGWTESLELLKLLVAPEIPDADVPVQDD